VAVSEEEFDRVRGLVEQALAEQFGDLLVPPAELKPGYWELWPLRNIRLGIEETRLWSYGVPGGGTGHLQIHIEFPYGNHSRIKARKGDLSGKQIKDAIKHARDLSDGRSQSIHTNSVEKQEAYLFGYRTFRDLDADRQRRFFSLYEDITKPGGGSESSKWSRFHESTKRLFFNSRPDDPEAWDRLFKGVPQHESPRDWSPRDPEGYDPSTFDMFYRGATDALTDWTDFRRFFYI
jgi:hypothetical protein